MENKVTDLRLMQLKQWLNVEFVDVEWRLEVASADASFRRYFRVIFADKTLIAMDAPPDKEDIKPFIQVASALKSLNVNVPEIYAQDLTQGFLLLQDFGAIGYLDQLTADNVDALYHDALNALLNLQSGELAQQPNLPMYDEVLLMREMALFTDWFLAEHLSLTLTDNEHEMLQAIYTLLCDNALEQPQVLVHRDYHSRNLMVYPEDNPGIIDFQDAVQGAVTYDLASLLRDCYISWPDDKVYAWLADYLKALQSKGFCLSTEQETFFRWFDLMGMQRHLKAIGIFSRLNYRDGKSGYLKDIPRTLGYVEQVSQKYPALAPFSQWLSAKVKPAFIEKQRT